MSYAQDADLHWHKIVGEETWRGRRVGVMACGLKLATSKGKDEPRKDQPMCKGCERE